MAEVTDRPRRKRSGVQVEEDKPRRKTKAETSDPDKEEEADDTEKKDDKEQQKPAEQQGDEEKQDDTEAVHTSDVASRKEGVAIGDVEPDPSTETHATDDADYAFPQAGDVDVADLSDEELDGETPGPIQPDVKVTLAETDNVPEELWGHKALVTDVRWEEDDDGDEYQTFTVKTRDEHDATLVGLTREDFTEVFPGGVGVRGFGP